MQTTDEKNMVRRIRSNLAPCMRLVRHESGTYQVIDPRNGFMVDDDVDLVRLDRETKILRACDPNELPAELTLSDEDLALELAKCRNAA